MARDPELKKTAPRPAPKAAADVAAPSGPADATEPLLDRAATILASTGEAPALLQEVLALQANLAAGEIHEDMVILLLEAAVSHHLPDILGDRREWAQELAKIAGV